MKKVDFLIEYEVKPREFDSMCLVAAYLKSKGYREVHDIGGIGAYKGKIVV